jgi:NADH-quinone oxidoreductase subunit M
MTTGIPILSLLIWVPVLGGLLVLTAGEGRESTARWTALILSVLTLLLSLVAYAGFDAGSASMQFVELRPWIQSFDINYQLGVDGIALPLILLTCFVTVLVVIAGWQVIQTRVAQYFAAFLIMEGLMNGVFAAMDAMLFYVFWEAMLVPMFIIIGVWGGPRRVYATVKFFLYTFLGSVFMLASLIYMYMESGSFEISAMYALPLEMNIQILIFLSFLAAFAVKVPMWPVHTWLPDAHVEAPTGGSVILAAIMLKMGGYGFLRFSLPITPDASRELDWLLIGLSLIAVVYIGFVALVQTDMKKLIAYSSIAHMGFVTLGFFLAYAIVDRGGSMEAATLGIQGGMVQMISHGLISGAMFLCVGVLYDRMHSREIGDYGGVVNTMPVFAAFMVFFAMSNAGLPGTSGFVGEFFVIVASFQANFWYALLAATTLILGAAYTLWMVKRVVFGDVANEHVAALIDISRREFFMLAVLAISVLALGLWPAPLTDLMSVSIDKLLTQVMTSKLVP